jgi:hypothetical protein
MSAWGHGFFENDNAGDWAYRLDCSRDLHFVEETLDRALGPQRLAFWEGEEVLAAAETVARLKGNWGRCDSATRPVDDWIKNTSHLLTPALIEKAAAALERIAADSSSLSLVWEGSRLHEEWLNNIADLRARIAG